MYSLNYTPSDYGVHNHCIFVCRPCTLQPNKCHRLHAEADENHGNWVFAGRSYILKKIRKGGMSVTGWSTPTLYPLPTSASTPQHVSPRPRPPPAPSTRCGVNHKSPSTRPRRAIFAPLFGSETRCRQVLISRQHLMRGGRLSVLG